LEVYYKIIDLLPSPFRKGDESKKQGWAEMIRESCEAGPLLLEHWPYQVPFAKREPS
jgi:hypothetical protein